MAEYEIKDGVGIIPEGTECPPLAYEKPVESKVSKVILPKSVTSLEAPDDLKKLAEKE